MTQDLVFPAYAGMIPIRLNCSKLIYRVPRIRGDDPQFTGQEGYIKRCSPHTRG